MKNINEWTIECNGHTYVTLYHNGIFVFCYDNDTMYMNRIIEEIEKRTGKKFEEIPIQGKAEDFNGLRFVSGFKDNWIKNPIKEMKTFGTIAY